MNTTQKSDRNWSAVEFETDPDQEDLASWLMMQHGANGCEVTQLGPSTISLQAAFDAHKLSKEDLDKLKSSLEEYGLASCLRTLQVKTIPDQDWLAEWKKGFVPFSVANKFLICPPWHKATLTAQETAGKHVLLVEPGMAFGTGLHATTQYCLKALEKNSFGQDVLDVGTGSGILAMAAALLHPELKIVAVDTDPEAIRVAGENLELNGLTARVDLKEGSTEICDNQAFDCILSNLTCEDIVALLLDYLRLLRPDGLIICAGILKEKLPLLEQAIATYPLSIIDQEIGEMWAGITLQRIPVSLKTA